MGFSNNLIREISEQIPTFVGLVGFIRGVYRGKFIQMPIKNLSDSGAYEVPVAYNPKNPKPGVRVHIDYVPGKTYSICVRKSEEKVPACLSSHLTGISRDYANSARLAQQRCLEMTATRKARESVIREYFGDKNE